MVQFNGVSFVVELPRIGSGSTAMKFVEFIGPGLPIYFINGPYIFFSVSFFPFFVFSPMEDIDRNYLVIVKIKNLNDRYDKKNFKYLGQFRSVDCMMESLGRCIFQFQECFATITYSYI